MRAIAVFVVAAAALVQAAGDDKAKFEQLETVWNTAQLRGDASALERLWHPDLQVIVPRMPVMSRAEAVAFARSGRMVFQRYESSELSARVYGKAAVVTGRLHRSRTINGRTLDDDWRFTKVYLQESGKWRVVSFQASEAAPQ